MNLEAYERGKQDYHDGKPCPLKHSGQEDARWGWIVAYAMANLRNEDIGPWLLDVEFQ